MSDRRVSICRRETHPRDQRGVLPPNPAGTAGTGGVGAAGGGPSGAGRSGPSPPAEHPVGQPRRRGLRLQPHGAARPVSADGQPSHAGLERGRLDRAGAEGTLGLLSTPTREVEPVKGCPGRTERSQPRRRFRQVERPAGSVRECRLSRRRKPSLADRTLRSALGWRRWRWKRWCVDTMPLTWNGARSLWGTNTSDRARDQVFLRVRSTCSASAATIADPDCPMGKTPVS
jgi:hypothetical protein